jgi:uncharacterized lipoprotein NlpE involved in copper resistance
MSKKLAVAACLTTLIVAGCGAGKPIAGKALAQQACLATGQQAAALAAQAAAANPQAYSSLSADEAALAAQEASRVAGAYDGDPSDDSGLGTIAQYDSAGSGASIKVMTDCMTHGLSVTKH